MTLRRIHGKGSPKKAESVTTPSKIENAGATIIAMFQVLALGIAILMLVVLGIRYVLSATTDKKAEIKKNMPNYFVGVLFTFSSVAILQIIRVFINKNVNS